MKHFPLLSLILCLCFMLTGCSEISQSPAEIPQEVTATEAAETVPPETIPTESAPEETVPEETAPPTEPAMEPVPEETAAVQSENTDPAQPLLPPPQVSEEACHFFDDAAFLGDSISYSLMLHHTKTGDFGDAQFFVRNSMGVHTALNNMMTVYYQGKEMTPGKALKASGVSKVFIMLGINDLGRADVDAVMESWALFLEEIRKSNPDMQVYLQALTPMWHNNNSVPLTNEVIDLYNSRLEEFAEANDCEFLDLTGYLKDGHNGLAEIYTSDYYVHMNNEGTAVWAKALKEYGFRQEKETP